MNLEYVHDKFSYAMLDGLFNKVKLLVEIMASYKREEGFQDEAELLVDSGNIGGIKYFFSEHQFFLMSDTVNIYKFFFDDEEVIKVNDNRLTDFAHNIDFFVEVENMFYKPFDKAINIEHFEKQAELARAIRNDKD